MRKAFDRSLTILQHPTMAQLMRDIEYEVKQAQIDALSAAAEIADNPEALFQRGQTINLDNQAGRIAAAIRAKIAELKGEK